MSFQHAAPALSATANAEEGAHTHTPASSPLSSAPGAFDDPPDLPSPPIQQPTSPSTASSTQHLSIGSVPDGNMGFKKANFREVGKSALAEGDRSDARAQQQLQTPSALSTTSFTMPAITKASEEPHKKIALSSDSSGLEEAVTAMNEQPAAPQEGADKVAIGIEAEHSVHDNVHPDRRHLTKLEQRAGESDWNASRGRARSTARGRTRSRSPYRAAHTGQYEDSKHRNHRHRSRSSSDSDREHTHHRRHRRSSRDRRSSHYEEDQHRRRSRSLSTSRQRHTTQVSAHQRRPRSRSYDSRPKSRRSRSPYGDSFARRRNQHNRSSVDSYRPDTSGMQRSQRGSSGRRSSRPDLFNEPGSLHGERDSYRRGSSGRDLFDEPLSQRSDRGFEGRLSSRPDLFDEPLEHSQRASSRQPSSGRDLFEQPFHQPSHRRGSSARRLSRPDLLEQSAPHHSQRGSSGRRSSRPEPLDDAPHLQRRWATKAEWSESPYQSRFVAAKDDDSELQIKGMAQRNAKKGPRGKSPKNLPQYDGATELEPPTPAKRAAPRGGKTWTPEHLLQNPKSKLAKVNLINVLKNPKAWEVLSDAQKAGLVDLMSEGAKSKLDGEEALGSALRSTDLVNDTAFRSSVALFQQDLSEGRLDPEWQEEGALAMEQRARGDFDNWKHNETEKFWGEKQKIAHSVLAGDSAKIALQELVAGGCFRVGDVWSYTRVFGKGRSAVKVEKEATIASITADSALVFTLPPSTAKFSAPAAGPDVTTPPIYNVQKLADAVIAADGRVAKWRASNAWKEVRCLRANQDMGSPWDVRELFWARSTASPPLKQQPKRASKRGEKEAGEAGEE